MCLLSDEDFYGLPQQAFKYFSKQQHTTRPGQPPFAQMLYIYVYQEGQQHNNCSVGAQCGGCEEGRVPPHPLAFVTL